MLICFAWLPAGATHRTEPASRHAGNSFELAVFRRDSAGPFYPHVALESSERRVAFFAGRLAGGLSRDGELPAAHAVSKPDVADWAMSPEPAGSWLALKADLVQGIFSATADAMLLQRWYYAERRGGLYLSNSLQYLKELLGSALEINEAAIPYMLRWGYLPSRHTPLKEVFSLRSRETLTVHDGAIAIEVRRAPEYHLSEIPDEHAERMLIPALREAVARELADVDSVCIPLSGGMDSRVLLGCALECCDAAKITTLSFGLPASLDSRIGGALAKTLGVKNLKLDFDRRPIGELLRETFALSEGIYNGCPHHPVADFRKAAAGFPLMLSGYVGDVVMGSYDLSERLVHQIENDARALLRRAHHTADLTPPEQYRPLLRLPAIDPLQFENELLHATGAARHRHADWVWENHQFNRTNFAVELYRDRTFYLTPYVHGDVLRAAYSLPEEERLGERAFFRAVHREFPMLYAFPTKSNYGFPLGMSGMRVNTARAWRKFWNETDKLLGARFGMFCYTHPAYNYAHPRELLRTRHRKDVLAALARLREQGVFDPDRMRELIARVKAGRLASTDLLQALLTVDTWYEHYA